MRASRFTMMLLLPLVAAHAAGIETHVGESDCQDPHQVQVRHPGINSNQPKGYTLHQTSDSEGLITGYTMVVDSVVCKKAVCQVVGVTMTWDALGRYESYRLEKESTHLEKVESEWNDKAAPDGIPFTDADYKKLDQILQDRNSALQTQTLDSLSPGSQHDEVDVVSGATPLNIKEAVVEGASLTCFHLWHWANGEVGAVARELTRQSCDEQLLKSFLASDKPHYVLFALQQLGSHGPFGLPLVKEVSKVMRVGGDQQFKLGYAYLQKAQPDRKQFHDQLAVLFAEGGNKVRVRLLGLLASEKELPGTLLDHLAEALPEMKNYYELHLFFSLLENHGHAPQPILTEAARLLDNKNFFIARRAYWYLEKQTVDAQITNRMRSFQEKCTKDGRLLK